MIAVISLIMGIAASAFTSADPIMVDDPSETYWFLMDANGTTVTTNQVGDPNSICPTKTIANCARQYNEDQTEIVGGVRRVKSGQENLHKDFRSKN